MHALREPDPRLRIRKPEARRHDPDDRARGTVEPNRPTDDRRIATQLLPQPVADDRDRFRTYHIVAALEAGPERWSDAEDGEQLRGRRDARHEASGAVANLKRGIVGVVSGDAREPGNSSSEVEEFLLAPVVWRPERRQLFLGGVWQRLHEDGTSDSVDRGRAPNAEGERQNRQARVERAPDEAASCVASVHDPGFH